MFSSFCSDDNVICFGKYCLIDLLTSCKGLTSTVEHKNEDIRLALRPPVFNFE